MERGTRCREGSTAESSPFCSLLNRSFSSLLSLFSILLFQSLQTGTHRKISHSVLKRQHTYKTRIYVVKSLHSVGLFLLFYFLSGDSFAGTCQLAPGDDHALQWAMGENEGQDSPGGLSSSGMSVTGAMLNKDAVQ